MLYGILVPLQKHSGIKCQTAVVISARLPQPQPRTLRSALNLLPGMACEVHAGCEDSRAVCNMDAAM